jgi:hypothetical protein
LALSSCPGEYGILVFVLGSVVKNKEKKKKIKTPFTLPVPHPSWSSDQTSDQLQDATVNFSGHSTGSEFS